jgi:hypothetical protein
MRKMSLFVFAAAAVLMLGLGAWTASTPPARVGASPSLRIDAIRSTVNVKNLPVQHYDDYSLVF